ncbi:efflux RND transporter periplasmic adaptor subunit [Synoicihabitans lomoniglobus]|uniref:Efflux RND transporter periplasmic adaptor subunit n=1 Tax=Synoicihabitans lomoniglobus TaxID=2909285 RepID=A0AAF0CRD9_9BACT|nr:efflux RND transporter periplasmic adaptor subunit [Opitutaceae bacterium LMO-M01]WED66680.1 efflux RND transporter periplasmic adaptor subunit [Opitutaceae bacterium LMO-M01]
MIKKFIIAFIGFILVVAALGAVKAAQIKEMMGANFGQPITAVSTAEATVQEWNPVIQSIGSLAPIQGVTISAELEGAVTEILVGNGAAVEKGDLLVTLDTTIETAQLEAADARAELARLQRSRAQELGAKNTISQSEIDGAVAQYAQAKADVAALKATLDKKAVRAPFSGRVGIRTVNVGQFVSRGTALMPLQKLDEVFVNFYVPQREMPKLGLNQAVTVKIDAFPEEEFTAHITAINPVVDTATRNVAVQATLPNPDERLRAGMFAQLEVVLPQVDRLVVVPSTAVAYASYGNSVYVVETMKDAEGQEYLGVRQQPVTLGRKRGDLVAVLEGLEGGEVVASAGVFKLRNGLPVQINNKVQPSASVNPMPDNT